MASAHRGFRRKWWHAGRKDKERPSRPPRAPLFLYVIPSEAAGVEGPPRSDALFLSEPLSHRERWVAI